VLSDDCFCGGQGLMENVMMSVAVGRTGFRYSV
jgi:hypothetical protein